MATIEKFIGKDTENKEIMAATLSLVSSHKPIKPNRLDEIKVGVLTKWMKSIGVPLKEQDIILSQFEKGTQEERDGLFHLGKKLFGMDQIKCVMCKEIEIKEQKNNLVGNCLVNNTEQDVNLFRRCYDFNPKDNMQSLCGQILWPYLIKEKIDKENKGYDIIKP